MLVEDFIFDFRNTSCFPEVFFLVVRPKESMSMQKFQKSTLCNFQQNKHDGFNYKISQKQEILMHMATQVVNIKET